MHYTKKKICKCIYAYALEDCRSYMIYRTAPFSMTLNDPTFIFKVTPFFNAECLRNGTTYRHSVIEILIGTYTRPTQQCHFEWPWVTLSDLAKYSMTRSDARSLCDSWASSFIIPAFDARVRGDPCRNVAIPFSVQKLQWCGYPTVEIVWLYV